MKKITVIMGGPSAEHEISLKTGLQIIGNLDRECYEVFTLVIDKCKNFFLSKNCEKISLSDLESPKTSPIFEDCDISEITSQNLGTAFLALHGEFGEDGTIQGFLKTLNIKHTGCSTTSSAIGMHKIFAKKIFESSGILTPAYSVFRQGDTDTKITQILAKYKFPLFVKAPQSGSSKLMFRVANEQELRAAINELKSECKSILIETAVKGDEFSCPVIEKNGVPHALTPIYIKPKNTEGFFDYDAKYLGQSEEICPPPFDEETINLVKNTALATHIALECDGYSRTDIIVSDERAFVLEINTLPGMTAASLLPLAYGVDGGTFVELLDQIIENIK